MQIPIKKQVKDESNTTFTTNDQNHLNDKSASQLTLIRHEQNSLPMRALKAALIINGILNSSYGEIGHECYYRSLITLLYKQARL